MAAVPAILDLIAGGIKKKFSSGPVAALFNCAVSARMGRPGKRCSLEEVIRSGLSFLVADFFR